MSQAGAPQLVSSPKARPLRVGVVGLGTWGREHVRAWRSLLGVELVAVCDHVGELAASVAAEHQIPRWDTEARSLVRQELALDAVSIVTDEASHLSSAAPFIEAGVSVLVEKPLALDIVEATELVRLAERAKVVLMPGHLLRFDTRLCLLWEQAQRGALGTLRSISTRRWMPRSRHAKYSRAHPALLNAIHDLDLMRWFLGSTPRIVSAWSPKDDNSSAPAQLWSVTEFDDGALGFTETGWVLPDSCGMWLESELAVVGTEGIARVRFPSDSLAVFAANGNAYPDTAISPALSDRSPGTLRDELEYFARCVRSGTSPERITPSDSLATLAHAIAVMEADRRGSPVGLCDSPTPGTAGNERGLG